MARRLREEVTCDAPGAHEGKVDLCEMTLGDGKLYQVDWCEKHQEAARRMLGGVKPKSRRRGKLTPVNPADIPRLTPGDAKKTPRR